MGMLVLGRLVGQEIIITTPSEEIRLMLIDIRGDKARLGFSAPPHVKIHRLEVKERIDANRGEATESP